MPLEDYERAPYDRATMIAHHLVAVDPDLPLIMIGQRESGKLLVASTHGGPIIEKLLRQALKELVIYPED
jgi:hypothetical protein